MQPFCENSSRLKAVNYFPKKSSVTYIWQRPKYVSGSYGYISLYHCVKSVRIQIFSAPYFPAFGLNKERYSVSLYIQSECGKMRTRETPNKETFHFSRSAKQHFDVSKQHSFEINKTIWHLQEISWNGNNAYNKLLHANMQCNYRWVFPV